MNKYNVSRSAVKNAVARLGLTNALAPNALIKYAQGAAFEVELLKAEKEDDGE